jgi:hypothetical protein
MPKEENKKILSSLIGDIEPEVKPAAADTTPDPSQNTPATQGANNDDGEGLVIPKMVEKVKAPKQTAEESAAILRKQRDEARQKAQELEEKLGNAEKQGTVFEEVKKLINKDDVTPEDLQQIFSDYEFTKKEKTALEENLKKAQDRLREYDINTSPEFQENFVKPIQLAADALTAEVCPIQGDEFIPVPPSAQGALTALLESGNITPATVKIALNKIKAAYENEDIDYEMPNVRNVTEHLLTIAKGVAAKDKAISEWETEREIKKQEQQENINHKNSIMKVKSRQERKNIAQEFLNGFVNRDEFEYLADDYGFEAVAQEVISQHSYLTDVIEDPQKAPTYDKLLEAYTKASLFDKLIEQKKQESIISISKQKEAKLNNAGKKPSRDSEIDNQSESAKLLQNYI